jgi:leucyl aminopeptidase (aminopeptidase T)
VKERFAEILRAVRLRYEAAELRPDERVVVLSSTENYRTLVQAYYSAAVEMGTDPILVTYKARSPFSGLPAIAVEAALQGDAIVDLCFKTWAYSDSFTYFRQAQQVQGGRSLSGLTYGWEEDVSTLIACPPDPQVTERSRRAQELIDAAETIRVTSELGTDFSLARGDAQERPSYAPSGQVAFAPPEDSSNGVIQYVGGFRIQAPTMQKRMVYEPVRMEVEQGKLVKIARNTEVGIMLDDWFRSHNDANSYQFAHINLGLDPRIVLDYLDNTSIHFNYGGVLVAFGANNEPRFGSAVRCKSHIDMNLVGADYFLDDRPIMISGEFTADSGLRAPNHG